MPFSREERERFMNCTYRHSTSEWESARSWMAEHLQGVARARKTQTYSEICAAMRGACQVAVEPHSSALFGLLGQICTLESEAGRPLISAVVLHKGDGEPGEGFWNIARDLGIDPGSTKDARYEFWIRELSRCHEYWETH